MFQEAVDDRKVTKGSLEMYVHSSFCTWANCSSGHLLGSLIPRPRFAPGWKIGLVNCLFYFCLSVPEPLVHCSFLI